MPALAGMTSFMLQPIRELGEERHAGVELRHGDKLVRGMGLLDVAGAADHRRAARLLEQSGLGRIGHRARAVGAGERQRQSDRLRAWLGEKRRHAPEMLRLDRRGIGATRLMRGSSLSSAKALSSLGTKSGSALGQAPHLPLELAGLRHDVRRRAALDGPDLHG